MYNEDENNENPNIFEATHQNCKNKMENLKKS